MLTNNQFTGIMPRPSVTSQLPMMAPSAPPPPARVYVPPTLPPPVSQVPSSQGMIPVGSPPTGAPQPVRPPMDPNYGPHAGHGYGMPGAMGGGGYGMPGAMSGGGQPVPGPMAGGYPGYHPPLTRYIPPAHAAAGLQDARMKSYITALRGTGRQNL